MKREQDEAYQASLRQDRAKVCDSFLVIVVLVA